MSQEGKSFFMSIKSRMLYTLRAKPYLELSENGLRFSGVKIKERERREPILG